jgi:RHS repeat-associated protein
MAGISSKAANRMENRFKYNGIEHNTNFDLNMYDAFYRNLDPQIGRFWQIDPEAEMLEEYSPYASMYNNPISNVDPLGNFASRFGAWLHRLFNGGGSIGENQYGEWYVNKSRTEVNSDGSVTVIGSKYYGKGRDQYSSAREALARDYGMMADIQMNGDKSIYQIYESSEEAGNAALSYSGLLMPDPILKSGTIAANTPKAVKAILPFAKGVLEKFIKHAFAGARHADLGLAVEQMAANGMKLIEQNASLLKAGDNTLVGTINGKSKSFKAFVKDGEIISVNMYPGVSSRVTQGTVINFGNVTW